MLMDLFDHESGKLRASLLLAPHYTEADMPAIVAVLGHLKFYGDKILFLKATSLPSDASAAKFRAALFQHESEKQAAAAQKKRPSGKSKAGGSGSGSGLGPGGKQGGSVSARAGSPGSVGSPGSSRSRTMSPKASKASRASPRE
ncbi:hypothetical protein BC831DRAFT_459235 [Entophlyctis helioformis]|nr:hypothetical protein BC831DRAFT_459235 [Entophlyctis helioformis]